MSQSGLLRKEGSERANAPQKMKIKIPHFDNLSLIEGFAKTLIGRCLNPGKQDMNSLLHMLPRIWNVEGRVTGGDLGSGRFQFDFETEEDIEEVMKMEPFHFDYWMLSIVRWKPVVDRLYPYTITFWIRILEVPIQFWTDLTLQSIGEALGEVKAVDLYYGRVQVVLNGFNPLVFETSIEFSNGEETVVSLRYERLFGFCKICLSLCHDQTLCTMGNKEGQRNEENTVEKTENEAKSMSYKAAASQGESSKQEMMIPPTNARNSKGSKRGEYHQDTTVMRKYGYDAKYKGQKQGSYFRNENLKYRRYNNTHGNKNYIESVWNGRSKANGQGSGSNSFDQNQDYVQKIEIGSKPKEAESSQEGSIKISTDGLVVAPNLTKNQQADKNGKRTIEENNQVTKKQVRKSLFNEIDLMLKQDGKTHVGPTLVTSEMILEEDNIRENHKEIEKEYMEDTNDLEEDITNDSLEVEATEVLQGGVVELTDVDMENMIHLREEEDKINLEENEIFQVDKTNTKESIKEVGAQRKKITKPGLIFKGACSKKRNVITFISPRKKTMAVKGVRIGDGLYPSKPKEAKGTEGGHPSNDNTSN